MRILHLTYFLKWGGMERQLSYLVNGLAADGHDVHVGYFGEGLEGGRDELYKVRFHQVRKSSHHDPLIVWRLVRLMRRIKPDVVQTWHYLMDVFGGSAARISGTPWVLRDPLPNHNGTGSFRERARSWIARGAGRIVTNSAGGGMHWQLRCPSVERSIVPNGIPLDEIEKTTPGDIYDASLGDLILYVGQLLPRKNVDTFIRALAAIKDEHRFTAVLCGDGFQRKQLEEISREFGIADKVRFLGQVPKDRVWGLLKAASAFVFLSDNEGCPNAVLEAMAGGCPLVVSDIPAHREILDESSALFVEADNVRQTAASILNVLRNPDESRQRSMCAKERIFQRSIPGMKSRYVGIYSEIHRHVDKNGFA